MDVLGIGPLELILVLVLALLIFGPEDLVSAGRKMGRFFNKVVKSDTWMAVRSISREMRNLPNKLAREAELDELSKELNKQTIAPPTHSNPVHSTQTSETGDPENLKAWTSPPEPKEKSDQSDDPTVLEPPDEVDNEQRTE